MLYLKLVYGIRAVIFRFLFAWRFGSWGKRSLIIAPVIIQKPRNIHLGDDVYVGALSCLAATPHTGARDCCLKIGDGSKLGRFNHIYATRRVEIGRKVLTANGVYISDNLHGYQDVDRPIIDQPLVQLADTVIGDGTWIGHNVSIFGVVIGRNCVVGANAVVTRDLPDYSVAVGIPARIIRRYDVETACWRETHPDGRFRDHEASGAADG